MSIIQSSSTTEWLTAAEAANYLKVERRTLLVWVREGAVKAYALHGTKRRVWRFRKEDLDAAMGFQGVVSSDMSSVVRTQPGGLQ